MLESEIQIRNFSIINTLLWPSKETTFISRSNLLSKGKESELEWGCKVYVVSKSSHTVNESLDSGGRLLWFEAQLYIGQVIKSLCFSFLVYKMGIVILLIGCQNGEINGVMYFWCFFFPVSLIKLNRP